MPCDPEPASGTTVSADKPASDIAAKVASYAEVPLTADLSHLGEGDRKAIDLLLQAGAIIDNLFWKQVWGDKQALLAGIEDPATRRFVEINYGPWDRLDNDAPFVAGIGPRPAGARFYPEDMTKEEFEAADLPGKDSLYTLIQRDGAGKLVVVPDHDAYKAEMPGTDADLNAYFALYYGGDANSGAKTIAINLPNDEEVQLAKGSRRLQLENTMRSKFDAILVPIADELIAQDQRQHITFDAFFENVMFHEVAHGLGIKNTLDGKGTVREALTDLASGYEEGKADILGLYMIGKLGEMGELDAAKRRDNYVTFLAGIFRSVRFGASSAHGKANMLAFNYLQNEGAFSRDEATGRYRVDFDRMEKAVNSLSARILTLQGDGDYAGAKKLQDELGNTGAALQADLDRLQARSIPVDIVLKQGPDVLAPK